MRPHAASSRYTPTQTPRSPASAQRLGRLLLAALLGWAAPAAAQTFPDPAAWVPLRCGQTAMTDRYRDESGALGERDIVGDLDAPAGYAASDDDFLYLRLRLDASPDDGTKLRPFAWGVAFSVDGDPTTYEILALVNGQDETVELYRNSDTNNADSPTDPADDPPLKSYPMATHGQVLTASDSATGDDDDFLLDFALPWAELTGLGLTPTTAVRAWAGSSSTVGTLNGDLACHDGASGAATLSGIGPGPTVLDATVDSDGDGYTDWAEVRAGTDPQSSRSHPTGPPIDPSQTGELQLEGGGGCALGRGPVSWPWAGGLLLLLGLLCWRRQRG